jgi:hypothetical protein
MKIINDGLPEEIYQFLCQDFYDHENVAGKISVTTLLKPPQMVVLAERYNEQIEIPASNLFYRVLGSGVHEVLSKVRLSDTVQEKRYDANLGGTILTGKPDLMRLVVHNGEYMVIDYKVAGTYKCVKADYSDWYEQLCGYRWLMMENGIQTEGNARIVVLFRDWVRSKSKKYKGYPQVPAVSLPFALREADVEERVLKSRLTMLQSARALTDNLLPPCNHAEWWWNIKENKPNRCETCDVNKFCQQYVAFQEGNNG